MRAKKRITIGISLSISLSINQRTTTSTTKDTFITNDTEKRLAKDRRREAIQS